MCGNTRPKLLDVSYGKTSQHKKAFTLTAWNTAHNVSAHTTVASRPPTHNRHPLEQPRGTTAETDEDPTVGSSEVAAPFQLTTPQSNADGGRRSRHSLWGRAKWKLPNSWRLPQSDENGTWYLTSHATRWLPSPWRMQQSLQPQVQS